jgi:hypothetical protein
LTRGIVDHGFDLCGFNVVLGDVLDISVWVVFQVPDNMDRRHGGGFKGC